MIIRRADINDLERITEIYNQAILHTVATFDTQPKTTKSQLKWFDKHNEKYPILVAEEENDEIAGWVSLSPWSDRCAYSDTTEISIYVDENKRGKGIGNLLMADIIEYAKENSHTIISRIAGENKVSIFLHQKYGFKLIGTMKEVGYKFDRYIDVHLFQLLF